jgi:hypothetical protein
VAKALFMLKLIAFFVFCPWLTRAGGARPVVVHVKSGGRKKTQVGREQTNEINSRPQMATTRAKLK